MSFKEVHQDIESENFYLFDKEKKGKPELIKVFPSKKAIVVGVDKTERRRSEMTDVMEGLFGIGAFARVLYTQQWQVVYEGQTISLFGKLKYDIENGTFNFNEIIGMYRGDHQQDLIKVFKNNRFADVLAIFGWGLLLGATTWVVYKVGKALKSWVQRRLDNQRRK